MQVRLRLLTHITLPLVCLAGLQTPAQAQAKPSGSADIPTSRIDIFGGYSYFHPYNTQIGGFPYQPINLGAVASVSGYFNRVLGVQVEGGFHPNGPNDCVYTAQAGPVARFQHGRFVPFVHALAGGTKIGGPMFQSCTWGWGVTGGGGFDYVLPGFGDHLAIRPIQADYEHAHVDFGPLNITGSAGGVADMNAYRLSSGIVLRFGSMEPRTPVALSCTVQPRSAYPGEPLTISSQNLALNPKKQTSYTWTSTGGTVSGSGESASIDTKGMAPGDYTVTGKVSQGSKVWQNATCEAPFTIKAYDPPTISCSASPSTVTLGESSTITANAVSPQNRQLTYSYSSTAGQVNGTNSTATLATAGVPAGPITITCNVVDDLGKSATATTTVSVQAPPLPPAPSTRNLCTMSFDRDQKRPARVDNEAKGCLDDIALTMNRESSAKLEIIGHSNANEQGTIAGQRAANVKQYLTEEKGIDSTRIEIRTGDTNGRSVETTLVPLGATFNTEGTTTVNEGSLRRSGQPYGRPHKPARR